MIGNTAESSLWCSSRSESDMLQKWISCEPFMLSRHGVNLTAPLKVCTKDKEHALVCFLVSERMKGAEFH
jgi:hypothetical protein